MNNIDFENTNPEVQALDTESIDIVDTDVADTDIDNYDADDTETFEAGDDIRTETDNELLKGFTSLPVRQLSRSGGSDRGIASLSVINSQKGNGNRVTFTETLYNALGKPQSLQFSINGSTLAIASELPGVEETYTFKKPDVYILYNKALVLAIAEAFELDYSDGTTSYSFRNIEYKSIKNDNDEVIPVALVTMTAM